MKTTPVKIDTIPHSKFIAEAISRHFSEEAAKLADKENERKKPA